MRAAPRLCIVAGVLAVGLVPLTLKSYGVYLASLWCVYLMAAFGLNLIVGYAGQMSIGQAGFFGIGAYVGALLVKAGLAFWLALPLAGLACFVVGLALGFPALRVQHHYLAFATLGFNVLVFLVLRNEEWLTGGTFGLSAIPRPSLLGYSLDGALAFFYLVYAITIVLALVLAFVLRSPWGRAFACLRDNPIRAESLGIDITRYTLLAFAIGAAYAGIGGICFAALVQYVEPGSFQVATSLMMLLTVIVGGSGRFFGPVVGSVIVILLPEWLRFAQNWYLAIFGFAVVALMIWLPGGLLSLADRFAPPRRRAVAVTALLEVTEMRKSYGAIRAVDGVSLAVGAGEIVGIIGPNGSGKTTLFDSILGQIRPNAGRVALGGEDITGLSPLALSRRGVGRTFQSLQVFSKLSVRDNLIAAAQEFSGSMLGRLFANADSGLGAKADAMIERFRLGPVARLPAGSLSYGQQKLIDIAMAFMPAPRLVLLDEPCAGVNPGLVDELRQHLLDLNDAQGGSFVVIEHNMDFVMRLCPRVVCMVEGRILAAGTPAEIQANPAVLEAYLGR